ncbi:NirD/YgiW/YdeI family stress tolerance protein [Enterovibrio sp. ZSDZ35]|uniref:NirD/YgiW/YdeI family stress tolerance protein n=1 Tax=Enterovibrio qingdaonensis TaxID=2899818 RepID=A0ABT5QFC1_9GAMM|nr:NirD/YgiW/YdeI family stress tolerance protein [Enterovibrio sp. ZSDZ35]MDD1779676.1 NirD/YgiW/YdeI family stress tolerance protein [Enterovibrio sp. ZSDZ35]
MKTKYCAIALILGSSLLNPAFAATNTQTTATVQATSSVSNVLNANAAMDDQNVVLTGYIVDSLGNEMYTFKDSTGMITVEIDDEDMAAIDVDATTQVVLVGEVDVEPNANTIAVDNILLANNPND